MNLTIMKTMYCSCLGLAWLAWMLACGCSGEAGEALELFEKGKRAYAGRRLDEAMELFSQAARKDGTLYNARLMMAKIRYYKKDFPDALSEVDSILNRDPDHAGALYWKARILVISGTNPGIENDTLAIGCLARVLETDSHHIRSRALLALLYERKSMYREALKEYHEVLLEEEAVVDARANLSILYRRMGMKDRSLREIETALAVAEAAGIDTKTLKAIKLEIEK